MKNWVKYLVSTVVFGLIYIYSGGILILQKHRLENGDCCDDTIWCV